MGETVKRGAALVLLLILSACRKGEEKKEGVSGPEKGPSLPTPVRIAKVERMEIPLFVSGPGKTAALSQQKIRAPFAGILTDLRVSDGDRVHRGQAIGSIVARDSEAALSGAREMSRQASTEAERRDGERAVAIAEKNLVRKPLVASWDGTVVSHAASAGDRLSEDQDILTISDSSSLVFLADLPQSDLARIRGGQKAAVELAGSREPIAGSVHSVLPGANPADFTAQIRIDLPGASGANLIGLFGTARILVGQKTGAAVVPDAAILRDDVSGVSRLCLVVDGKAHWIDVVPGAKDAGRTEIVSPPLADGQAVVVSGLVGLPEGKNVSAESP